MAWQVVFLLTLPHVPRSRDTLAIKRLNFVVRDAHRTGSRELSQPVKSISLLASSTRLAWNTVKKAALHVT